MSCSVQCTSSFVKNAYKVIYVFMKEYISSSKNRKALTADYLNAKIPTYPKEQYGKEGILHSDYETPEYHEGYSK